MPAAPASPYKQLSQSAPRFQVRVGNAEGEYPTEDDWNFNCSPSVSSIRAGGRHDDVITIKVLRPAEVSDGEVTSFLNRQVEIWAADDLTRYTILIAWGFICSKPILIDSENETYSFEARIRDSEFGIPLDGYPTWDPALERLDVTKNIVFNPEIDGIICANMSDRTDAEHGWHYFVDPESMRTAAAIEWQEQAASNWQLSDAVLFLCWWLNVDGYIDNPTQKDVDSAFSARNDLLKNVTIPIGTSLPDALDLLLTPFEYGWSLQHAAEKVEDVTPPLYLRKTTINFFRKGIGPMRNVAMPRHEVYRDIRLHNLTAFDAVISNVDMANRVIVYGDYEKREVTIPLYGAWLEDYDERPISDTKEGAAFHLEHPEVGRKFVADFAGDYKGLRADFDNPFTMTSVFRAEFLQVIRRRFWRCLSQHTVADDEESNGYFVEWWNQHAKDAVSSNVLLDPGWQRVKWPFSVLEKEGGIVFNGETAPPFLWKLFQAGTPPKVRITCTIIGDNRVKGDATRLATSSNKRDIVLVLDMSDKFQDSVVVPAADPHGSRFASRPTDARDDRTAIQTYAETVRTAEDCLTVEVSLPLEGVLHPEYRIGDVITEVAGRNLSLKTAVGRFPQVVGIKSDFDNQTCELLLESFRKERPKITLDAGKRVIVGTDKPPRALNPRKKL